MECPKCKAKMSPSFGEYGHECKECGCIVCHHCNHAFAGLGDLDSEENYPDLEHLTIDYYCPNCSNQLYSSDY